MFQTPQRTCTSCCLALVTVFAACATPHPTAAPQPQQVRTLQIGDGSAKLFLRYSPDGRQLAAISQFGPVLLIDTADYRTARTFAVGMRMVTYSADGRLMATAEGTDGARVWSAAARGEPVEAVAEKWPFKGVARVYALERPLKVLQAPGNAAGPRVFWTEFSPDGQHLLTTHADGHVEVWDARSWTVSDDITVSTGDVRVASFAPDSKTLIIGGADGALHVWSIESKMEIKTLTSPICGRNVVVGIVFSPDGGTLLTSHVTESGASVVIWGTAEWSAQEQRGFRAAAFSQDGKWIALGGSYVELANTRALEPVRAIPLPEMTFGEALGPLDKDSKYSALANDKFPIVVQSLAFSPDGTALAAGCADGSIRILSLPQ